MALVGIMRQWSEGVAAADKGDWNNALKSFTSISDPRSKICFNIGCCHLVNRDLHEAEKAFTMTIDRDKHLAVGYFQRGSVFFKKGVYSSALEDWYRCFAEMRGNQLIDYRILGLTYKLYSCEILYNVALAHCKLGEWAKAEEKVVLALNQSAEPRHTTKIERALQNILKQKDFSPVEMPQGRMFHPNERMVEQLEKKDYLGKSLVVASVVDKDSFSGFAPLQPQANAPPPRPRTPEILRTLEGEPHRVLFEFNPETVAELGVMPGNIVFVLKKGEDNWATVMFNGKKGIVPCNYLEPMELQFQPPSQGGEQAPSGSPQKSTIPAPPAATPPERPPSVKDQQENVTAKEKMQVYYKYTVAIQVSEKLPYEEVLKQISIKVKLSPCSIQLSFRDGEEDVLLNKDNMEKAWKLITENCLKLKCKELKMEEHDFPVEEAENRSQAPEKVEIQVHALFNYEALQPEDLPFNKGDIIKVISKVSEEWWEGECHGKVGSSHLPL